VLNDGGLWKMELNGWSEDSGGPKNIMEVVFAMMDIHVILFGLALVLWNHTMKPHCPFWKPVANLPVVHILQASLPVTRSLYLVSYMIYCRR